MKPELKSSIRTTEARGFGKRSRACTVRTPFNVEERITVVAASEQLDVVEWITDFLIRFAETNPVKPRLFKLKVLAAANNLTVEEYVQEILRARFSQVDYNFDEVSALDRVLDREEKCLDIQQQNGKT